MIGRAGIRHLLTCLGPPDWLPAHRRRCPPAWQEVTPPPGTQSAVTWPSAVDLTCTCPRHQSPTTCNWCQSIVGRSTSVCLQASLNQGFTSYLQLTPQSPTTCNWCQSIPPSSPVSPPSSLLLPIIQSSTSPIMSSQPDLMPPSFGCPVQAAPWAEFEAAVEAVLISFF